MLLLPPTNERTPSPSTLQGTSCHHARPSLILNAKIEKSSGTGHPAQKCPKGMTEPSAPPNCVHDPSSSDRSNADGNRCLPFTYPTNQVSKSSPTIQSTSSARRHLIARNSTQRIYKVQPLTLTLHLASTQCKKKRMKKCTHWDLFIL